MSESLMLRWARYYSAHSLSVIPIAPLDEILPWGDTSDGKTPRLKWEAYQQRRANDAELERWFGASEDGALALVTGPVSGNLVILDFDGDGWEHARDALYRAFPDLRASRAVETGSGRRHVYLRFADMTYQDAPLTRKVYQRPDLGEKTAIEVRGDRHYTLAPPSVHPSGGRYMFLDESAPIVTLANPTLLLTWLAAWEAEGTAPPKTYRAPAFPPGSGEGRPGDDFNARGDVIPLLEAAQWHVVKQRGDITDLRRPGKDRGISATWNYYPRKFYVFTSNGSPFEPDHAYDAFSVYALLEHGGDFSAAARELRAQGYGAPAAPGAPAASSAPAPIEADADAPLHALSDYPDLPEYARLTPAQAQLAATACPWLDAWVEFAQAASPMTPPAFHTAAGLFIGSLALARRLYLPVSVAENAIYPNLYMLYIGPSTAQRKSTALRVVKGVLKAAGLEHFLLADQQTPEAMALDMTQRVPNTYESWQPLVQQRWLRERALAAKRGWLLEEAAKLLDSFNRDFTAGLLPMVLDLYDCPAEAMTSNTLSRGRELVEDVYLSIFGVTTYGDMAEHLKQRKLWSNGLFARFSLVGSDDVGTWQFWPEPRHYPHDLLQGLRRVATQLLPLPEAFLIEAEIDTGDGAPHKVKEVHLTGKYTGVPVELARGSDAWNAWERYARATGFDMLHGKTIGEKFKPSYGRLGTMLVKIATILAAFDAASLPVSIAPRHLYRAQQILEAWRGNLHEIFDKLQDTENEDGLEERIKLLLAKTGRLWVSQRDLLKSLHVKKTELELCLPDLIATEEIEVKEVKNERGRPTLKYRLKVEKGVQ